MENVVYNELGWRGWSADTETMLQASCAHAKGVACAHELGVGVRSIAGFRTVSRSQYPVGLWCDYRNPAGVSSSFAQSPNLSPVAKCSSS